MSVFLFGLIGGILLSLFFSFGPAFFSQIQTSIHYGFKNAVPFVFGVSSGDVVIVALLLLITRKIPIDNMVELLNNRWLLYIGATVVAGFGLYTILLKTKRAAETQSLGQDAMCVIDPPNRMYVYLRGLTLNFLNPIIWVYWTTIITLVFFGEAELTVVQRYIFFCGVLTATLGMDILKCKLASLLQRIITYRFLNIFNKCVGIILIGFAIFMVVSTSNNANEINNGNTKSIELIQEMMSNAPPIKSSK